MINRDLIDIFIELAREKNIERSELGTIIEDLFLFIIDKETGDSENCSVIVNLDKGEIEIYVEKTIALLFVIIIFEKTIFPFLKKLCPRFF